MAQKAKLRPFVGAFTLKVRKDGRIRLPKKLVPHSRCRFRLFVVEEKFLRLYPEAGFKPDDLDQSEGQQTAYGAVDLRNGYLRIPRELRALVFQTGEAVVVGMLNAIDILDAEVWKKQVQREEEKVRSCFELMA